MRSRALKKQCKIHGLKLRFSDSERSECIDFTTMIFSFVVFLEKTFQVIEMLRCLHSIPKMIGDWP